MSAQTIRPLSRWAQGAAFIAWLAAVGLGWSLLWEHDLQSAPPAPAPQQLPAGLRPANASLSKLIMALHPRCPCSRASMAELSRLLAAHGDRCEVTVLVYQPPRESPAWAETALTDMARRLGCDVRVDEAAAAARALNLTSSGEILCYDPSGLLRFQGGITAGRGHEGDNRGKRSLQQILTTGRCDNRSSPAFGCPLGNPK